MNFLNRHWIMRTIGVLLMVAGFFAIACSVTEDTTIPGREFGGRIHNIGLIGKQQAATIANAVVFLAGVLLYCTSLILDSLESKLKTEATSCATAKAPQPTPWRKPEKKTAPQEPPPPPLPQGTPIYPDLPSRSPWS